MSKQTFLKGTFILIIAGLITRFLGFVNRIVVARIMGAEGVGLYVMAVPTLLLVITITQFGLPVAISKLVAEADALNDRSRIKRILVVSTTITLTLSIVFTTAMILLAPMIASTLLTDSRAYWPLVAISPIVPIVALSSVMRGYFQGLQNMKPTAYSQVIEQVVRITFVALLTSAFLPLGVEYAAAGAMISVVLGELASLLYMIVMFKRKKSFRIRQKFFAYLGEGKKTFVDLMAISLPTTGSRLVGSVSYFFEPIVVAQSLAIAGVATAVATQQYGQLAGFVIPLLTLPTFITYSLSVSLVPAISEAAAKKRYPLIHHRLGQSLRLAMLSGGISVVVLYVFAEPVMALMYDAPEAAVFIKVMAPFTIFLYFQGPLQSTLQALNLAKAAMMNSFYGAIVKIAAIFALATRPELGIMGAALAIVIGILLVTTLHFASVVKTISLTVNIIFIAKASVLLGASVVFSSLVHRYAFSDWPLMIQTLLAIGLTVLCYALLALLLGLVKKEEATRIPLIGSFLSKLIPA
ncbi:stage V sporulation protein B [Halalkalibacterium halodurans]|uniref:stage V sporulation protein B n=1 Tax=Halalkalibacterium halodurans TaxID=86665 RepID=UPI002E235DDC|nr:stage V sporulation protein B [Halalkalibacterium halodurans]MED4079431.1 stage V sporulation protein B [Halalkalibacterium halodurans]MED4086547.1 stage V sporulation protein B [Halalkalibacterium halodurans]MED4104374.1 stage V sporulation protein B [Halalkalibacterium halodurans]MED4108050.1 stage V sporulation protein B [Halalkalibacterium halodurans]MED4147679.1 stage V sporulation protein B [Halalkalibacterium halodurans]